MGTVAVEADEDGDVSVRWDDDDTATFVHVSSLRFAEPDEAQLHFFIPDADPEYIRLNQTELARRWEGLEEGEAPPLPPTPGAANEEEGSADGDDGDDDGTADFAKYVSSVGQRSTADLAGWGALSGEGGDGDGRPGYAFRHDDASWRSDLARVGALGARCAFPRTLPWPSRRWLTTTTAHVSCIPDPILRGVLLVPGCVLPVFLRPCGHARFCRARSPGDLGGGATYHSAEAAREGREGRRLLRRAKAAVRAAEVEALAEADLQGRGEPIGIPLSINDPSIARHPMQSPTVRVLQHLRASGVPPKAQRKLRAALRDYDRYAGHPSGGSGRLDPSAPQSLKDWRLTVPTSDAAFAAEESAVLTRPPQVIRHFTICMWCTV